MLLQRFASPGAPARNDVTRQGLRLHDSDVGFLTDGKQIIHNVSGDTATVSPMVRNADLMHCPAIDPKGFHAWGYKNTRLDQGTSRDDGGPVSVRYSGLRSQFGRDLGEQLRLQLAQMREIARHAAR